MQARYVRCLPTFLLCLFLGVAVALLTAGRAADPPQRAKPDDAKLFARENLVAWCVVPFDGKKRGPEQRAAMLERLGIKRLAYDYRAEHIPTFDAEMEALKKHNIELTAWWFPRTLNAEARTILDVLKRHQLRTQLWVTGSGGPVKSDQERKQRIETEADRIRPIAEAAKAIGCQVALYNHGGWFGEPENQIAIVKRLNMPNVGIVYNLHHGHEHLDRFPELLQQMKPHLLALNLNGMSEGADRQGNKILPLSAGQLDVKLLQAIHASGWRGPVGILNHTNHDAEARLQDNLDGLDWLLEQLQGNTKAARPKFRTFEAAPAAKPGTSEGASIVPGKALYRRPPITVDCRARLGDPAGYNILVASDPKNSGAHWEVFSMAGDGTLTAYLPGMKPDHVRSKAVITDDKPHHIAMAYEANRVRLYVDGKQVADTSIEATGAAAVPGELGLGRLVEGGLAHHGRIDYIRIRTGIHTTSAAPKGIPQSDSSTVGLWPFPFPAPPARKVSQTPWSEVPKEIKQQDDNDWEDSRWQQTETGPIFSASIQMAGGPTLKGVAIRVGENREAAVCFDTAQLTLSAAWTGDFLTLGPRRFGLINRPLVAGTMHFRSPPGPGWAKDGRFTNAPPDAANVHLPKEWAHYKGLSLHGNRVVLKYTVGGTTVLESPWIETALGKTAFTRTLQVEPHADPMTMRVCDAKSHVRVVGSDAATLIANGKQPVTLRIPPSKNTVRLKVLIASGGANAAADVDALARKSPPPEDLTKLMQPAGRRWDDEIVTQGVRSPDSAPYVIDTITLPFKNPYKSLFFTAGHDFFSNGDAAICTAHGEVWVCSGIDDGLKKLTWKRYAAGLYQPLGLKIVDDRVYVLGRDQVTRLHDVNDDGEADVYENFNNDALVTGGGHDYVTCLDTDPQGNFYFIHATTGVMRVSKDGSTLESVATGFRNPNGMGVGPDGTITAAPQEGTWTPASNIVIAKQGGYYGFGGPQVTDDRPLGYDLPMCYMPRDMDNSSGGQTWVTSDRWGPLEGQMLHLSFGQCRILLALREQVDGYEQGGVVSLSTTPGDFESGIMRGRFSPHDGQLYVSGLRGWQTRAVKDGCFQRLRYTGQPVRMPIAVKTMQNGIALTFSSPLDSASAQNPDNYRIQQWNHRWTKNYGSPDFLVSDPRREGRDEVEVLSATLLEDQRTVFLEMADVKPVMQTSISYSIAAADGAAIRQKYVHTIHAVRKEGLDPTRLARTTQPGRLDENTRNNLRPGLLVHFQTANASNAAQPRQDVRVARIAALSQPVGAATTPFLPPGPVATTMGGYLHVPLNGRYTFQLEGAGTAQLQINGKRVLAGAHRDLSTLAPVEVSLHKGYNRIALRYANPPGDDASVRLLWSSETFAVEAVPPAALFHDGTRPEAIASQRLRRGRELFATRNCGKCHRLPADVAKSRSRMLELDHSAPNLRESRERLSRNWVYHWLLEPESLRNHATMPQVLGPPDDPQTRRRSADIAAFLTTPADGATAPAISKEQSRAGEILFEDLGCIACHKLTEPKSDDEFGRTSLHYVAAKFRPGALRACLQKPHRHYSASRMPDFALTDEEATTLAGWLRATVDGKVDRQDIPAGDAKRGAELFKTTGCNNCHSLDENKTVAKPEHASVFGSEQATGCLAVAGAASKQTPRFPFTAADRDALVAFLKTDGKSLGTRSAVESSMRQVARLNCLACHDRDATRTDRGIILIEEGGRGIVPEVLPNLTWAGEKLWNDWTERLLAGKLTYRTRPWLKARMPRFPAYAASLAEGLAAEHGIDARETNSRRFEKPKAQTGELLTRKIGGLDCRQCHGIGKLEPEGDANTKIALGVNFAHVRQRLRPDFYTRFVLDPPRFDLSAKMPKFSEDGVTTQVRDIEDGDFRKQIDALWHYIQTVETPGPIE